MLSSSWISHVAKGCPNLEIIYFTRRPGEKALGWDDVIKMQTMRDPCVIKQCYKRTYIKFTVNAVWSYCRLSNTCCYKFCL
jgi:hypothetical protein